MSDRNPMNEPAITVNGTQLTQGQAMTVRVALSLCDFDCGDDEFGKSMQAAYHKRQQEVLRLMIPESAPVTSAQGDRDG